MVGVEAPSGTNSKPMPRCRSTEWLSATTKTDVQCLHTGLLLDLLWSLKTIVSKHWQHILKNATESFFTGWVRVHLSSCGKGHFIHSKVCSKIKGCSIKSLMLLIKKEKENIPPFSSLERLQGTAFHSQFQRGQQLLTHLDFLRTLSKKISNVQALKGEPVRESPQGSVV